MNKEIIESKDFITSNLIDAVTIPRREYNELIAAKIQIDMILASADESGYGCADIVKGIMRLDRYGKALSDYEKRITALMAEHAEEVNHLKGKIFILNKQLAMVDKVSLEETADA